MSLVGTRPPTLDEWEKYELHHRARLAIKPGITGMWQVSGRNIVSKNTHQGNPGSRKSAPDAQIRDDSFGGGEAFKCLLTAADWKLHRTERNEVGGRSSDHRAGTQCGEFHRRLPRIRGAAEDEVQIPCDRRQ